MIEVLGESIWIPLISSSSIAAIGWYTRENPIGDYKNIEQQESLIRHFKILQIEKVPKQKIGLEGSSVNVSRCRTFQHQAALHQKLQVLFHELVTF